MCLNVYEEARTLFVAVSPRGDRFSSSSLGYKEGVQELLVVADSILNPKKSGTPEHYAVELVELVIVAPWPNLKGRKKVKKKKKEKGKI